MSCSTWTSQAASNASQSFDILFKVRRFRDRAVRVGRKMTDNREKQYPTIWTGHWHESEFFTHCSTLSHAGSLSTSRSAVDSVAPFCTFLLTSSKRVIMGGVKRLFLNKRSTPTPITANILTTFSFTRGEISLPLSLSDLLLANQCSAEFLPCR
ncbi:hypothetical protein T4E_11318 [Trichinella pseudospiralis]|uniref:Uncharacterized protein n=2 Tax=Trichinella pseudospiralis TaxID=6337 RepID=A0A0V0XEF1_TRIPS|nr:hypothetical protein T4E_11318 [Trichinella pseudospiralis]